MHKSRNCHCEGVEDYRVFDSLYSWLFGKWRLDGLAIDLDSTVMMARNLTSLFRQAAAGMLRTLQTLR